MSKKNILLDNTADLENFLIENQWQIFTRKDIDYGLQIIVTDGSVTIPINLYTSGRIIVQGKNSNLKTLLTEWSNLQQAGLINRKETYVEIKQNRITKYLVITDNIDQIKKDAIAALPGELTFKEPKGVAELYRAEVHLTDKKVSVTQYKSGTLLIQGLSGNLFDSVCETLDEFLSQSFSDRASRFIPEDPSWSKTATYLEKPDAENEATQWLLEHFEKKVLEFLNPNDQQTLTSAAGVRNAILKTKQILEDYSVVVMPFAKVYEGFLIRLAIHFGMVETEKISKKSNAIEIGNWIEAIRKRIPDPKRYSEITDTLAAAWGCRNKAIHSDFVHPYNTLHSWEEAESEISTILRAMSRAHRLFIVESIKLQNENTNIETKTSEITTPLYDATTFSSSQEFSNSWIGVDESGKGDLFGPLVVGGVIVNPEIEVRLAKFGVRDSKTISDNQILELAKLIKELCEYEIQILLPPDYNVAYENHGYNLNELLAWAHAQVIVKLGRRMQVHHALSDQFGDKKWLKRALETEKCSILLEQHPKAESDMAVAAASIIARAAFVESILDFSQKSGLTIPLGSSALEVKETARIIFRRWGEKGLIRITKMHFKTIREIINESKS